MTKKTLNNVCLLPVILIILSLCGCTQPGGRIGEYFGNWVLETITIDGQNNEEYSRPVIISFQSSVFCIGIAEHSELFGTWEEKDGNLILTADLGSGSAMTYPPVLGWGDDITIELRILEKKNRRLTLQYASTNGTISIYRFRKAI